MDPEALEAKGLRPSQVRQAHVEHFEMRLGERATLAPVKEGVMRLTHAEIDQLYSQPSVVEYRPEPVLVDLGDGSAEPALCFNLPRPPDRGSGNPQYAAALQAVARTMVLPESYVAKLTG
ncbi:hypothetical protein SAMN05216330_1195 [Bradyrhizobium sp. Ghvi]|nr:hypothetical protein SAMN05216330_1195 [Bradyrhizobium sp. Ghvi]